MRIGVHLTRKMLCALAYSILLLPLLGRANVITAAVGEFPPYTSQSALEANLSTEIVIAAYQEVGFEVDLLWGPWTRAYQAVKFGQADISFPWRELTQRKKDFWFSHALVHSKELFFHKRDVPFFWETFSDLQQYKIGGTATYAHVAIMRNSGVSVITSDSERVNIEKLYKNRIDAFPMDQRVAQYLLVSMSPDYQASIVSNEKELAETTYHVIFSKVTPDRSQNLIKRFHEGLAIIKKNGTYEKILSRYD